MMPIIRATKSLKRRLGIEIHDQFFKLVEIEQRNGTTRLYNYLIEAIPEGWIESGVIKAEHDLVKKLSFLLSKNKIKAKDVHLAITSQNLILRPLQLPNMEEKMLRKAIDAEIHNNIQLPFSHFVYDYAVIPKENESIERTENGIDVMVVIAPQSLVESYVQLFEKLGLRVKSVDLSPLAIFRFLERERKANQHQTFMMVHLYGKEAEISLFHRRILRLSRMIPLEYRSYYQLGADEPQEALDIDSFANDLIREIERILNFYFYTLNNRDQQLTEILVVSDRPSALRIAEILQAYFQVPAVIQACNDIKVAGRLPVNKVREDSPALIVPLGLAIKDVKS
jgi:type IV pilus assembly protein PilM